MFNPEEDLRRTIFEILGGDGKSISALSRELEKRGYDIHRLILTGYLRALTDLRILREREVPPAKIYAPVRALEKDIYVVVGEKTRQMAVGDKVDSLILFLLYKLFRRPVFLDELKRAGVEGQPPGRVSTPEERQEANRVLARAGWKIPDSSKAYVVDDESLSGAATEIMRAVMIDLFDVSRMVKETTQMKLSL